jgi:hypothetical protein
MTAKPRTIDEYLAGVDDDQRAALNRLRRVIQSAAPRAEECISYGLAAFRLDGRALVAFGATRDHCAFFPMSGTTIAAHADRLGRYKTSKGTIRFQPDNPLPMALVRLLVKARIAENAALQTKPRKSATKSKSPPKAGAPPKAKPGAREAKQSGSKAKPIKVREGEKAPVVLLSGGNPQIANSDGDAPVQAYIAAMPGWKSDLGKRLDALIVRNVPNVRKAVRWNTPFYGIEGQGWFLGFHVFTRYVKVSFFRGTSLRPVPPGGTVRSKDARWIDIREGDELDEAQMATWVKQAAALPGWVP